MKKTKNIVEITILVILTIIIAKELNLKNGIVGMLFLSSSFVLEKYILDKYVSKMYIGLILIFILIIYARTFLIVNGKCSALEENLYKQVEYEVKVTNIKEGKNSYKLYLYLKKYHTSTIAYLKKEENKKDIYEDGVLKIYIGNELKIKGIVSLPEHATNFGQFDEYNYLLNKKIKYKLLISNLEVTNKNINILGYISILNNKLCEIYKKNFNEKDASLLCALVLGKSEMLDEEIKELYKNGGIIHVLAISGLHISIINGFILFILSRLKLGKETIYTITNLLLVFYMFLTGLSVSVMRATIMNVLVNISQMLKRKLESYNALCIAGIVILAVNPLNLYNVGFQLSFIATLTLNVSSNLHIHISNISEKLVSDIFLFLMMTPILAYNFYEFQGLSILANLFIQPFTKLLMILSILVLPLKNQTHIIEFLTKTIELIIDYYQYVLEFINSFEVSKIIIGKIDAFNVVLFYLVIIIGIVLLKLKQEEIMNIFAKAVTFIWILILLVCLINSLNLPKTTITFLDVGHGDACVLISKTKKAIVIDGGGLKKWNEKDTGNYIVYPFLKYKGIDNIELVIVTHPDNDHIKGILELVDLIKINKIILPKGKIETNPKYVELIEKCEEKGIEYIKIYSGYRECIDDIELYCTYPFDDIDKYDFKTNNYSLNFLISYKEHKIYMTGDLEKEGEGLIVKRKSEIDCNLENIELMKVGHHGSDTSSTQEFIDLLKPKKLIVTGDDKNVKQFRQKVIWSYKKYNPTIYYTAVSGMIEFDLEQPR